MTTTTDIRTLTGKLVAVEDTTIANGTPKIILSVLPFSSALHPVNFGIPQFMQPLYENVIALLYDPETASYKADIHVTTQSMKNSKGFIDLLSIAIAEDGVFYDSQDKRNTPPPMQKPVTKIVDEDDISDVLDKELINPYPFGTDAPVGMPKHLQGIIATWNTQLQIAFAQGYNLALGELSYQDDPDVYIDRAWFHFQAITHITHIKPAPEINGDDSQGTVDTSDSDMVIKAEE